MSDTPNDLSPRLGGQTSPPGDEPALTGDRALLHALEMLSAPDEQTRQDAAFALADLGDERAIEHLARIIRGPRHARQVRRRAAAALIDALTACLADTTEVYPAISPDIPAVTVRSRVLAALASLGRV